MSPVFLLCVILAISRTVSSADLNAACNKDQPDCADPNAVCNTDALCKCKEGFMENNSNCVANSTTQSTKTEDVSKPATTANPGPTKKPEEEDKPTALGEKYQTKSATVSVNPLPTPKDPSTVPAKNGTASAEQKGSAAVIVLNVAYLLTSVLLSLVVQA